MSEMFGDRFSSLMPLFPRLEAALVSSVLDVPTNPLERGSLWGS